MSYAGNRDRGRTVLAEIGEVKILIAAGFAFENLEIEDGFDKWYRNEACFLSDSGN